MFHDFKYLICKIEILFVILNRNIPTLIMMNITMYDKKYDISQLMDTCCGSGVPASFQVIDYFEFSKNDFQKIIINQRLYKGVKCMFEYYCSNIIPELFDEYKETKLRYQETQDPSVWYEYNKKIDILCAVCNH